MAYARGKRAIGVCDECSFQWPLAKLTYLVIAETQTKIRVCPDCFDEDQPQLRPAKWVSRGEAIAVRDPRPDPAGPGMNSIFGWAPVVGDIIKTN